MNTFRNKTVAVLGFGVEGQSAVSFLIRKGAKQVTVFDEKHPIHDVAAQFEPFVGGNVDYRFGPLDESASLSACHMIVVSPGIRFDRPAIQNAIRQKIPVTTPTNIFMDLVPCPVIGVTGTKGKGTTSSLITEMLKTDGRNAFLGGNIGTPPLDFLDTLTPDCVVVLELSSFQTFHMTKSPHIAVILMTTVDHLDYHPDIAEYVSAKTNLIIHQKTGDIVVANEDYPNSLAIGALAKCKKYAVSMKRSVKHGAFVSDGNIYFADGKEKEKIVAVGDIYIPGKHNWENVASAVCAARAAGVHVDAIRNTIRTFKGLPHRIELVREVGGVRYYDDSFSTNPETAIAAIAAFSEPKVLILGGSSKNADFTELGDVIRKSDSIRAVIGIGAEWERIKHAIGNSAFAKALSGKRELRFEIREGLGNMTEIVEAARNVALAGDVVILTPACASFDMFKNYKDRGDQFKVAVNRISRI